MPGRTVGARTFVKHFPPMTRATLATAAILVAGALIPEPPRALQALTALAMLGALGAAGDRLARWLCPGFEILSRMVAAFTFAVALAVVPATWMGQLGVMRPAPFLLWVAAALLLSRLVPVPPGPDGAALVTPGDRLDRIEWALLLATTGAVALVGLKFLYHYRWVPVGLGPDDESYHLAAMAVWHRFGDLRMIKFAVGDTSTTFYPVGGEVWSWVLLAPLRDSDFLARFGGSPTTHRGPSSSIARGREPPSTLFDRSTNSRFVRPPGWKSARDWLAIFTTPSSSNSSLSRRRRQPPRRAFRLMPPARTRRLNKCGPRRATR